MRRGKKVLIVLTSHAELGDTGEKTGFWFEETATPYYIFRGSGLRVVFSSPAGHLPPLDPRSDLPEFQTAATRRFEGDPEALRALSESVPLDKIHVGKFDAVFYPGGHGPMWDLAENLVNAAMLEEFHRQGKVIGAVCHGPAGLLLARREDGKSILADKKATCFTNSEEALVGLDKVVPFLLETRILSLGAEFSRAPDFSPHVVQDGLLVTGQNPASSEGVAKAMVALLFADKKV